MALGLCLGCADRKSFVGSWQGRKTLPPMEGVDPSISGTLSRVRLTVRPSDRFLLVDGGLPKEGEMMFGGDTPVLSVDTFVGQAVAPEKRERYAIRRIEGGLRLTLPDGDVDLKPSPDPDRNGK